MDKPPLELVVSGNDPAASRSRNLREFLTDQGKALLELPFIEADKNGNVLSYWSVPTVELNNDCDSRASQSAQLLGQQFAAMTIAHTRRFARDGGQELLNNIFRQILKDGLQADDPRAAVATEFFQALGCYIATGEIWLLDASIVFLPTKAADEPSRD